MGERVRKMFKGFFPKLILIALISIHLNQSPAVAAGRASDTLNTILSGAGVPSATLGINGDCYIDTKNMNFYGPKKNNRWPIPTSLRGPAGPIGPAGVDGKNGASGSTSDGKVGATGATGATGSSGSSAIFVGNIGFANLINGVPGSSTVSSGFGNFSATKSYLVDVLIYATNLSTPPFSLKVNFTSSTGAAIITTKYLISDGSSYRQSSSLYEYAIFAKLIVNGSAETTNFNLIATVQCGESTGTNSTKLTVNGDYVAQEIGTIN